MPWNLFSQLPWTLRELLSFLSPFISCFSFQSAIFALQTLTECNALCPESVSSGICSRSICSFISLITIVITKIFVQLLIDFRNWKCQLFSCAWLFVIRYGLYPARLLCPWNSLGKNTGVGCHSLLQGTFQTQGQSPRVSIKQKLLSLTCLGINIHGLTWQLHDVTHPGSLGLCSTTPLNAASIFLMWGSLWAHQYSCKQEERKVKVQGKIYSFCSGIPPRSYKLSAYIHWPECGHVIILL